MLHFALVQRHIAEIGVLDSSLLFLKFLVCHHVILKFFKDLVIVIN